MPEPRLKPLPAETNPELKDAFQNYVKVLGFVPNSVLIMQRKPKLVRALSQLASAVWDPESEVPLGFKRLIALIASHAAGCQYCMAHTAGASLRLGIDEQKLDAVWEYRTSPLFSAKERVALDFALAGASQPNDVTDEMFAKMMQYWSENEIVEITGVIALFGFMNRWNDTMATPLEAEPVEVGEKHLASKGWSVGKHQR
jgi:uncharacterized peroxidase-related enzyme